MIQTEHNIVKNPNWLEANQLAICKRGRGFELRATVKQIQVVVRARLETGTAGLRIRRADHSATLLAMSGKLLRTITKGMSVGEFFARELFRTGTKGGS